MYTIRENVKIKDLDPDTQKFLIDMGFLPDTNLSDTFKKFLEENNINLNEPFITHEYKTTYFLIIDGSVVMHSKNHEDCLTALCDIPFEIECYPDIIAPLSKDEIMRQSYMDSHEGVTFFVTDTYRHKDEFVDIDILDVNYVWDNWNEPVGKAVAQYLSVHMDIVDLTIKWATEREYMYENHQQKSNDGYTTLHTYR